MDWYAFFRHVGDALNPAWISAILAAIGVIIALTIWWWPRRVFRGSGAAIIALLGEPSCEVMCPTGRGRWVRPRGALTSPTSPWERTDTCCAVGIWIDFASRGMSRSRMVALNSLALDDCCSRSTTTDDCSQGAWQGPSVTTAFGVPVVGGCDVGARGTHTMSLGAKSRSVLRRKTPECANGTQTAHGSVRNIEDGDRDRFFNPQPAPTWRFHEPVLVVQLGPPYSTMERHRTVFLRSLAPTPLPGSVSAIAQSTTR